MDSSRSSTEELERALKQAEAERIAAIDALDLVEVGPKVLGIPVANGVRVCPRDNRPVEIGCASRKRWAMRLFPVATAPYRHICRALIEG